MFFTPRLRLRAVIREDLPIFARWFSDVEVLQYLSRVWPHSVEDEEEWFQKVRQRPIWERPFAIDVREGKGWKLIGNMGLNRIDWINRSAILGIAIGEKDYWDRGYGTEAVQAMLALAFDILNLNRVELEVFDFNVRARKSYEKAGFRLEGRRRQVRYLSGRYHDVLVMGILRHEWEPPEWWKPFPLH